MKIYLTGFMGSGKTTYGEKLAKALGYAFLDLDKEIEKKNGLGIPEIFEKKGEDAFRKMEAEALRATEKLENTVIATGGGAPVFHDNMAWMNEHGRTIYLKLFEGELYRRLQDEWEQRPLLKQVPEEELQHYIYETLRQRAFYYHQAQVVIDPLEIGAEEVATLLS